jgi:hypothetical protein
MARSAEYGTAVNTTGDPDAQRRSPTVREPDEHVTTELDLDGTEPRPHRRRLAIAALGLTTVALGAAAVAVWTPESDPTPTAGTRTGATSTTGGTPTVSAQAAPGTGQPAASTTPGAAQATPSATRIRTPKPAVTSYRAGADTAEPRAVLADVPVTVVNSGSPKEGRTLKVVSARGDLSHEREMVWVVGNGDVVGEARCTQTFKISFSAPVKKRPTMLLCWRLSSTRSAYTLMVDLDGKPSTKDSVAALNKAWDKLA